MSNTELPKKKRGRKTKQEMLLKEQEMLLNANNTNADNIVQQPDQAKKRGRKPKGGKIITNDFVVKQEIVKSPSIILYLKCKIQDIDDNQKENISDNQYTPFISNISYKNINNQSPINEKQCTHAPPIIATVNNVSNKINQLKLDFSVDYIHNKQSACFWCTCEFDTPCIYIPKHFLKNSYHVYGCFCSPECAIGYLLNETIDNSLKFERLQLFNYIYGNIFEQSNFKAAPNPYFTLDKFYGNLTIDEYRQLKHTNRIINIIDKPLTRVIPDLYEITDNNIHQLIQQR